jgi:hypothetical protein
MNVVLFASDQHRLQLLSLLGVPEPVDEEIALAVEHFYILKHTFQDKVFYTCTFPDTRSEDEFKTLLVELCAREEPWVPILFINAVSFRRFQIVPGINRPIFRACAAILIQRIGIRLDPAVVDAINQFLNPAPQPQGPRIFEIFGRIIAAAMVQQGGPSDDDDEDDDFVLVQDASLNQNQPPPRVGEVKRRKIEKTWEEILKPKSEPVVEQSLDPVCVICMENKATICFVDCQHQVCCDECVRNILSRKDTKVRCPVCLEPISTKIVRPIYSAGGGGAEKTGEK